MPLRGMLNTQTIAGSDNVLISIVSSDRELFFHYQPPPTESAFGMSRGAVMLYNGQDVGEPAAGAEGFGGDDARTSIFDYWSMPEFVKWVSDHSYDGAKLSDAQERLRQFYGKLLNLVGEPAFRDGLFFGLNRANNHNLTFGRVADEAAGGHWMYASLRFDPASEQRFLVIVNLHKAIAFRDVQVVMPAEAFDFLRLPNEKNRQLYLTERLAEKISFTVEATDLIAKGGCAIPELSPLTPCFFEIKQSAHR